MAQVLGNLIRGSIFRSRARGPSDSRIVLVTAGYSWEPGAESRTLSNTCSNVSRTRYCGNDSDAQYFNSWPGHTTVFNPRTAFKQTQLQPTPIKNRLSLSLPEQNDPSPILGYYHRDNVDKERRIEDSMDFSRTTPSTRLFLLLLHDLRDSVTSLMGTIIPMALVLGPHGVVRQSNQHIPDVPGPTVPRMSFVSTLEEPAEA
ncbi:hypothetical protein PIB30_039066 [Stylosanthes scabra]|uniref:Uncharacterized protein n=1 Tax=Stylosanthes scabra TaxID=79078 RepID=A0ABU6UDH9_9FABA|nr:hypothetical protein [Stylosanthes scabra]